MVLEFIIFISVALISVAVALVISVGFVIVYEWWQDRWWNRFEKRNVIYVPNEDGKKMGKFYIPKNKKGQTMVTNELKEAFGSEVKESDRKRGNYI